MCNPLLSPWGVPAFPGRHPLLLWASLAVGQIPTMGSWPQATFIPIWASLLLWVTLASTRVSPVWIWGALGFPLPRVSLSQSWGVPVSLQGHPFRMEGMLVAGRIWTKGSHPPLIPTMPPVLVPWLLPAPFVALPSPLRWQFPLLIHPVAAPPSYPRFLFRVVPGIIRVRVLLSVVIRGGAPLLCLPAHGVALLVVRLHQYERPKE